MMNAITAAFNKIRGGDERALAGVGIAIAVAGGTHALLGDAPPLPTAAAAAAAAMAIRVHAANLRSGALHRRLPEGAQGRHAPSSY